MDRITKAFKAIIPLTLLLLFEENIDKQFGGIAHLICLLSILTLIIVFLIRILAELIDIWKNRHQLKPILFIPLSLYLVMPLLIGYLIPKGVESKVVLRACYEGTQNQAVLKLKENKTFELHWTGVFFYSKWYEGTWSKKGDTIVMEYRSEIPKGLGKKIVLKDNYLIPVDRQLPIPMFVVCDTLT